MEGDREVIRRDRGTADQVEAQHSVGPELGTLPEPPGEVDIAGIVGLSVRPDQTGSQVERPGRGVGAHSPILDGGHLAGRRGVNHALGIPGEERQVQRIHHLQVCLRAIRNERTGISSHVPGASPSHLQCRGSAASARHTKVREQAEAAQHPSGDDQQHQADQQRGRQSGKRPAPGMGWRGQRRYSAGAGVVARKGTAGVVAARAALPANPGEVSGSPASQARANEATGVGGTSSGMAMVAKAAAAGLPERGCSPGMRAVGEEAS